MDVELKAALNIQKYENYSSNHSNVDIADTEQAHKTIRNHDIKTNESEGTKNNLKNDSEGRSFKETEDKYSTTKSNPTLEKAIDNANKTLMPYKRQLKYSIHEKTNKVMVKVIDQETQEVIKEIPPEKVLDAYVKMLELAGLLYDSKS